MKPPRITSRVGLLLTQGVLALSLVPASFAGIALKPTSGLKIYGQGQDTREWDSDRPNIPGVRGNEGRGYNYASGDKDPNDNKSESFQTLFPSNHAKFGDMDQFVWRNIHNLRFLLSTKQTKLVEVELTYNADWLADTNDYWYRGQNPLRTTTPAGVNVRTIGADSFAGHEVDFVVRWKPHPWLNIDTGYSHFFAGNYLRDTGPSDDAEFGYVQTQILF